MNIREERIEDYPAVYALIKEAFATAEHSDGNEQDLVVALRSNKEVFLPALSLVAEQEGEIVGHILFTKAKVRMTLCWFWLLCPLSRPASGKGLARR